MTGAQHTHESFLSGDKGRTTAVELRIVSLDNGKAFVHEAFPFLRVPRQ